MRTLVVYDSQHGDTEALARAIGAALAGDARVMRAPDATAAALEGLDLLIVGAPTHGGRPMPSVQAFLDKMPAIQGTAVAVFDTLRHAPHVEDGRHLRLRRGQGRRQPQGEGGSCRWAPPRASSSRGRRAR